MPSSSPEIYYNHLVDPIRRTSDAPPMAEVRAFHQHLPHFRPSALVSLPSIATSLGIGHLLLKNETSRLGLPAFKILGASYAIYRAVAQSLGIPNPSINAGGTTIQSLASAARDAGFALFAATDGNHGRAVARMAALLTIPSRIYVPGMLDMEAITNIESEGAEVIQVDGDYDDANLVAKTAAEGYNDGRGLLINDTPFEPNDQIAQWIVDGYSTMFSEIDDELQAITGRTSVSHIFTPVGSGSLAQAVVTHYKGCQETAQTKVIAVESDSAACLKTALECGKSTSIKTSWTICTGLCCGTLSANAWPVLQKGIDIALTVHDQEVHDAVLKLKEQGLEVGPCGAATLAGLRRLSRDSTEGSYLNADSVVVILCTEGKRQYVLR